MERHRAEDSQPTGDPGSLSTGAHRRVVPPLSGLTNSPRNDPQRIRIGGITASNIGG